MPRAGHEGARQTRAVRIRRRLLAEAVQENVDTIEGVRRVRGGARRRGRWLRTTAALVLPGLAVAGVWWAGATAKRAVPPPPPAAGNESPSPASSSSGVAPEAAAAAPPAAAVSADASPTDASTPFDPSVFPLAVRKIVLDPGHGGPNKGAISPRGVAGPRLFEKDVTLDLARRLRLRLVGYGFQVALTRDQDRDLPLVDRARFANQNAGDLFVSIHLNWIEGRRGVETYYLGATADPELTRLAASENGSSGYGFADMRRLLDGVYVGLRRAESRAVAERVQSELYRSLTEVSPGLRDRGVKTAPFLVLVDTGMPAILAEVSCLSDAEEVALLRDGVYRDRIADALGRGLRGYAEAVARPPTPVGGAGS